MHTNYTVHLRTSEENEEFSFGAPATALDAISDSFSTFMRENIVEEGGFQGALTVPDDNLDAWEVLFHWKQEGRLPAHLTVKDAIEAEYGGSDSYIQMLCHCWLLGKRWDIPLFQDAVMRQLLSILDHNEVMSLEAGKLVFETSKPNSKLCMLLCEEIVLQLKATKRPSPGGDSFKLLADLAGIEGLKNSTAMILRASVEVNKTPTPRTAEAYLVGGGGGH